ncbi:cytochrome P450 [Saccharopolyspora shandongensis]|uniref:cytochrome P450 n=1 Tax=Saccharopolyspora shandongensis TaxID=418495 RepID=UPI00342EFDB7
MVRDERLWSRDPHHWRLYADGVVRPDSGLGPMMFPRDNAYFADGDTHRRLRAPLDEGLAGLDVHGMSRVILSRCTELIDQVAERGRADLVAEYAAVVPMLTVAGLFGLDTDQGHQLRQALIALFGSGADSQAGNRNLERILTTTIQARRALPDGDLTTAFLRHPNLRTDYELQQSMVLMISAGYETTCSWIAQALRLMLTDPRFSRRVRGGRLGVDDALNEVLWRDPPMANMPARYALADCVVAGRPIQRGDAVILGFAAGNADPRVHTDDPWLEIDNRAHLAFSAGPHTCPAHRPAWLIARIAVETALHRLHDLVLDIPADQITLLPSPWTRCPASLPVRFTPARRTTR